MNKTTIRYFEQKHCPIGYGNLTTPDELYETSILDYLCKWTKKKKVKVYKHSLRREEENISKTDFYNFEGHNGETFWDSVPAKKIPYCDWVYYLDIYYQ